MIALDFSVAGVRVEPYAVVPTLVFEVAITERSGARISSIGLHSQLRIEPDRRRYDHGETERVAELFGAPGRWADTQQPFLWTHADAKVPAFHRSTVVELFVGCSYELEVAAARYLHALQDGNVPLLLLFSGPVFAASATGGLSVEQIPWDREARFRMPVRLWRDLMDTYYPGGGWLRLPRETIDALGAFKARNAIPTWDGAIAALLAAAGESGAPEFPGALLHPPGRVGS